MDKYFVKKNFYTVCKKCKRQSDGLCDFCYSNKEKE